MTRASRVLRKLNSVSDASLYEEMQYTYRLLLTPLYDEDTQYYRFGRDIDRTVRITSMSLGVYLRLIARVLNRRKELLDKG